jgi:LysM repeat protein
LNIDIINSKEIVKDGVSKKGVNYYNKIVISSAKKDKYTNDRLSNLSIEIENAINDSSLGDEDKEKDGSEYEKEIKKEVKVRSNEMRFIIVKKGDSLSKIAKRAYGDYDSYVKIFEANPEIIKNPNQIYAGEKLRIPL